MIALKHKDESFDTKLALVSSSAMADSPVDEDTLAKESDVEVPFKAAPLSNQERLILRKQALKMKKRPVLAVGNPFVSLFCANKSFSYSA